MNESPVMRKNEDGTVTMEWRGPPQCMVAREVLEEMVATHNEVIRLRERCAHLENEIDGHRRHYICKPDRREP